MNRQCRNQYKSQVLTAPTQGSAGTVMDGERKDQIGDLYSNRSSQPSEHCQTKKNVTPGEAGRLPQGQQSARISDGLGIGLVNPTDFPL